MENSSEKFLELFRDQFNETDTATIALSTNFREIGEWSSLVALYIIAMADEHYNVTLNANDMKACTTVEDIYNIINQKAAA